MKIVEEKRIELPLVLADGCLFQTGVPVRVWGRVFGGAKRLRVSLYKGENCVAEREFPLKKGSFDGSLPAQPAGTGYRLVFAAEDLCRRVENVAVGNLFLAGGQSNMGWRIFQCYNRDMSLRYQAEIDASFNPNIRLYGVLRRYSDKKTREVRASFTNGWQEANPSSVHDFGAVAYFFAKRMWELTGQPVGVVMSCMGGIPMHCWQDKEGYLRSVSAGYCEKKEGRSPEFRPASYFNGSIYPLRKVPFRGAIWYQGEGDHEKYAERLAEMVRGWRAAFGQSLPFADCGMHFLEKEGEAYALCRIERQRAKGLIENYVYAAIGDTGLPVADIGVTDDLNTDTGIHPYDKKTVGYRTADAFYGAFMGGRGLFSAPELASVRLENGGAVLRFTGVGDGLVLKNQAGFYARSGENLRRLTPRLSAKDEIFLPAVFSGERLEYGFRFADERGEKPRSMADCVGVYNSAEGEVRYPLNSFLTDL